MKLLDFFANWLCARPWVLIWAEKRGSAFAVRLHRLCIARQAAAFFIRWSHLISYEGVESAIAENAGLSTSGESAALSEVSR